MIIECPNCFLEQPKDQYCAGCGKELDKLLVEKNKRVSAHIKKANYSIVFIITIFLVGSYLYYSVSSDSNFLTSLDNSKPLQKIVLQKTKIIRNKSVSKPLSRKKNKEPDKKTIRIKKTKIKSIAVVTHSEDGTKTVNKIYFISLENCDDIFSIGELDLEQRTKILKCANIHFQTSKKKLAVVLDDAPSFATQAEISIQDYLIELSFKLTTDIYEEEFKQTLPLDIEPESIATLWPNTGHDIESVEKPDSDMLSSYATSALFNFNGSLEAPPKLYFLASYN